MTRLPFTLLTIALLLGTSSGLAEDGVSSNRILLGQSCALKGPARSLGNGMKTGLEVYFDWVNSQGGIDGRKIILKSINDGYNPKKCIKATRALIEKLKVFLMIGEIGTPTSKVAVPICETNKVPFVAPFTGAEFLRNPFKRYVVNLRGSYYQEMERLARYLVDEKGLERIACFYQDDSYGRAGLNGIIKALDRRGMTLVSEGTYRRNTIAVANGVQSIASGNPEAVVMVGAYTGCAAFIKAAKKNSVLEDNIFCNISFVGTRALLEELGDVSEGCIVSQVVPFPWDTEVPVVAEFHQRMNAARKQSEIGFISLEGYLAGKLFSTIVDSLDGDVTREKFLDQVSALGEIDLGGIKLSYGTRDHQGMDQVFLTVFRGGEVVPLGGTAPADVFLNR